MEGHRDQATNEHVQNIRSGLPVLNSVYGLSMDEYDYLDMALDALRDIKNFGTAEYVCFVEVNEAGVANLPCNVNIIDAVTTNKMARKVFNERMISELDVMRDHDDYFLQKNIMENIGYGIESGVRTNLIDSFGDGYISYTLLEDRKIKVGPRHYGEIIGIAYTGISTDTEGYPMITRKQANALAAITAKNILTKKAFRGDRNSLAMLEMAINNAGRLKQAASIPEHITDNEIDTMLNAKTSFNRKTHNRPTKYGR